MKKFDELVSIMKRLRKECPWDREQDLQSLRTYLMEEAYETLDAMDTAISEEKFSSLNDELGDLLLQILFQAEILSEKDQRLGIESVLENLKQKLIRRHPHIYAGAKVSGASDVKANWDQIKAQERDGEYKSYLDGVPKSMTALQRAIKLGKRAKKAKFDWSELKDVWDKTLSELKELEEATTKAHQEEEVGDLLFCLAQWARHRDIDLEVALTAANKKFETRFRAIEGTPNFENLSLEQKEKLWQDYKETERSKDPQHS